MNIYIIAGIALVALILLGMNQPGILYGSPEATGQITVTDLGNGAYNVTLNSISDSGRDINFYYGHGSNANLVTVDSVANPNLPNIQANAFTVAQNNMYLKSSSGCISSQVGIEQPIMLQGTNANGGYYYAMGIVRGFGSPYCNGGQCQADCNNNIPATTAGSIIIVASVCQPNTCNGEQTSIDSSGCPIYTVGQFQALPTHPVDQTGCWICNQYYPQLSVPASACPGWASGPNAGTTDIRAPCPFRITATCGGGQSGNYTSTNLTPTAPVTTTPGTASQPANLAGVLWQWLVTGFNMLLKLIGAVH